MLQCDSKNRRLSNSVVQQRGNLCRVMAKSHKLSRDVTVEKKAGTLKSDVAADKKKKKVKKGKLFTVHLQSVEARSSRYWNYNQSHGYHELVR